MTLLETLFPTNANNDFQGSRVAVYFLVLFTFLMMARSLIHFTFEDGGSNVIGNLVILEKTETGLDPNKLSYAFAKLGGLSQLIICVINIVVLFRYRNLIPLMYLLWIVEWGTRLFIGAFWDLIPQEYHLSPAPAVVVAPYLFIVLIVFFTLSLRQTHQSN